ncbi:MAG: MFS transporter [Chlamydiae bacterium]|nr:MFS transporter [Chlamydiota bacterium]
MYNSSYLFFINMKTYKALAILLVLASFAPAAGVLFTPALPDIVAHLHSTKEQVQSSMTLFLMGYAMGHLPWGPIANAIGRRATTILGLSIAVLGSLVILTIRWIPALELFNVGRFILGFGASAGVKIGFTYISDLFEGKEVSKKIAYLMLSFALAPGLAVFLGGMLTRYFGWYYCLIATFIYALMLIFLAFALPETLLQEQKIPLRARRVFKGYKACLQNPTLVKSALLMGCRTSFIYVFASLAPFIGMQRIGLHPDAYGCYNSIPLIGTMLGFAITQRNHWLPPMAQIKLGIAISFIMTLVMFAFFLNNQINVYTLFIPMPFIYLGLSLVFANISSIAIRSDPNRSNASAVTNFLNMSLCFSTLLLTQNIPQKGSLTLPSLYLALSFFMICLIWSITKDQKVKEMILNIPA